MAEFPALPLWTDAYLADTAHLSDAENGLYIRLLIAIWRAPNCKIPNDDSWLSRRFGDVPPVRSLIKEFCKSDGNWITQKRLLKEWKFVRARSQLNSEAAKSRWKKEKHTSERTTNRHSERNAPTPTPTPTPNGINKPSIPSPASANGKAFLSKSSGKNGNGHVTIKDPSERLARFQKKLAESFPENGWMIVASASDPATPDHARCLSLCQSKAKELGKGWPNQWPQ